MLVEVEWNMTYSEFGELKPETLIDKVFSKSLISGNFYSGLKSITLPLASVVDL